MRNGFLGSVTAFLAGAGLALAQYPVPQLPAPTLQPGGLVADPSSLPGGPAGFHDGATPGGNGLEEGSAGPGCGEPCCGPSCQACGPRGQFWFSGEYLLMWMREFSAPPLVTSSPAGTLPVLGAPGTQVV